MKGDETTYEWVVEETDGDTVDSEIIDCAYFSKQTEALKWRNGLLAEGKTHNLGLCKRVWENQGTPDNIMLDLRHQAYAYVDDAGKLPATFDDGSAVPARFGFR